MIAIHIGDLLVKQKDLYIKLGIEPPAEYEWTEVQVSQYFKENDSQSGEKVSLDIFTVWTMHRCTAAQKANES